MRILYAIICLLFLVPNAFASYKETTQKLNKLKNKIDAKIEIVSTEITKLPKQKKYNNEQCFSDKNYKSIEQTWSLLEKIILSVSDIATVADDAIKICEEFDKKYPDFNAKTEGEWFKDRYGFWNLYFLKEMNDFYKKTDSMFLDGKLYVGVRSLEKIEVIKQYMMLLNGGNSSELFKVILTKKNEFYKIVDANILAIRNYVETLNK